MARTPVLRRLAAALLALALAASPTAAQQIGYGPPGAGGGGGSGTVNAGTTNQLGYYAGVGTAITGLATANSGVLVTSGGGVPSISSSLPSALALGTPASGVATNLTGTAAGLTAGTVTTNANLTGPVTSVGNATTVVAGCGLTAGATVAASGRVAHGDNTTAIASATSYVGFNVTLTAPRTVALPAANSVAAGCPLTIVDETGAITGVNIITLAAAGADTLNGAATYLLSFPRSTVTFRSNGVDAWNISAGATSEPAAYLDAAQVFTKRQGTTLITLTDGATVTPDFSLGNIFTWTLGATGRTLATPTNIVAGSYTVFLVEDGTGSRTITTWGAAWKFPGGIKPTLSTAAGAKDAISCVADTTSTLNCVFAAAFQ